MFGSERAQRGETRAKEPTRHHIQEVLRREFGNTADTEYLLDDLKEIWKTFDLFIEIFSVEDAQKMINAPPESTSS
jgi:hypothetical protein